jgi:hypothetical protein
MITNLGTGLSFRVNDETGDNDTTPFVIDNSGNVGIQKISPSEALDVNGNITLSGIIKGNPTNSLRLQAGGTTSGSAGNSSIFFLNSSGQVKGRFDTEKTEIFLGSGSDGNYTCANTTCTINNDSDSRFGIKKITATANSGQKNITVTNTTNFNVDDEVLIIQMQGIGAGQYEFGYIASIPNSTTITLRDNLTYTYTVDSNSSAQIIEVPHFNNVTVTASTANATLTAPAWDGSTGGILIFRATGQFQLNGTSPYTATISTFQIGFRGGAATTGTSNGQQGESIRSGQANSTASIFGGGGGGTTATTCGGGGGGASFAAANSGAGSGGGNGGRSYGDASLQNLYLGSGGGAGGKDSDNNGNGGAGGKGGGIMWIIANQIIANNLSLFDGRGQNGLDGSATNGCGGGGGGGGVIWLQAYSMDFQQSSSTLINVAGGNGGAANGTGNAGGAGGAGRLRLDYKSINYWPLANAGQTYGTSLSIYTKKIGNNYGSLFAGDVKTDSADVAEKYPSKERLEYGDIVSLADPFQNENGIWIEGGIEKATQNTRNKIIGVVSTEPGLILGENDDLNQYPIALIGRVPVKVSNLKGPIKVGDRLTIGPIPGIAVKADTPGLVIGTAMENFDSSKGIACPDYEDNQDIRCGKIMIFVNLSWYDPDVYLSSTNDFNIKNEDDKYIYDGNLENFDLKTQILNIKSISKNLSLLNNKTQEVVKRIGVFAEILVAKIKTGFLETEDAIINNVLAAKNIITENIQSLMLNVERLTAYQKIISPIVETTSIIATGEASLNTISTNEIKPQNGDLVINLNQNNNVETQSIASLPTTDDKGPLARLIIKGLEGKTAVTIDASGNASFSGQISSSSIVSDLGDLSNLKVNKDATISGTLSTNTLNATEASISGKIIAKEVEAENIKDLENRSNVILNSFQDLDNTLKQVQDNNDNLSSNINEIQKLLAEIKNQPLPDLNNQTNLANTTDLNCREQACLFPTITVTGQSNLCWLAKHLLKTTPSPP